MRATEVVIITHSEILASGIKAMLCSCGVSSAFACIHSVAPDRCLATVSDINNRIILIADTGSIDALTISELRDTCSMLEHVIGIYHSALPQTTVTIYDSLMSVYDGIDTLKKLINSSLSNIKSSAKTNSDELTPREKEIVKGVVKGLSNKEIANQLSVSVNTVMTHRRNIASKLQIHSPAGLTIYAIVSKLVSIDEIKSEML